MSPDDFPFTFRWDMVRAYPMISGVPDAREATREQVDAGFLLILKAGALQRTLALYLVREKPPAFGWDR